MRRRILLSALTATGLLVVTAPVVLAQPGGLPDALTPLARAFGLQVAEDARDSSADPDAISGATSGSEGREGGMPTLTGMTGDEFGQFVSDLASSEPGAAAAYFRSFTPSASVAGTAGQGRGRDGAPHGAESTERPGSLPDAATGRPGAGRP
jgi:hypothetical protein